VPGRCGSDHDRTTGGSAVTEVIVELPDSLREELGEPAGPLYTDTDAMLAAAGEQLVTVGDVVTYHVLEAGVEPSVRSLTSAPSGPRSTTGWPTGSPRPRSTAR